MNKGLTEQDYKNLDIVFGIARKASAEDENSIVELINLRRKIIENLKDYDAMLLEKSKLEGAKVVPASVDEKPMD